MPASTAECPDKCIKATAKCEYLPGFKGASCAEVIPCPHSCNDNGDCWRGKCFCHPSFKGEDCGVADEAAVSPVKAVAQQKTLSPVKAAVVQTEVAAAPAVEVKKATGALSLKADGSAMLGNFGIGGIAVGAAVMGLVVFAAVSRSRRSTESQEMSARSVPLWVDEQ